MPSAENKILQFDLTPPRKSQYLGKVKKRVLPLLRHDKLQHQLLRSRHGGRSNHHPGRKSAPALMMSLRSSSSRPQRESSSRHHGMQLRCGRKKNENSTTEWCSSSLPSNWRIPSKVRVCCGRTEDKKTAAQLRRRSRHPSRHARRPGLLRAGSPCERRYEVDECPQYHPSAMDVPILRQPYAVDGYRRRHTLRRSFERAQSGLRHEVFNLGSTRVSFHTDSNLMPSLRPKPALSDISVHLTLRNL